MNFSIEIYCLGTIIVLFILAFATRPNPKRDFYTALILSTVGMVITLTTVELKGDLFYNTYRIDLYSQVFKVLLSMGLFLIVFLCSELKGVLKTHHTEFYFLLFTCTLAMMLLVSSVHLLTIYLSLELSSYCLYALVFLRKERHLGLEASLRYFLIGASASAIMLFGIALLYGATGASYLIQLVKILPPMMDQPVIVIGLLLTLFGFFFKLAVFPFHFWASEVYHAAPNQLAGYIATVSKIAAIAILLRIIALCGNQNKLIAEILIALSIISMTIGNISALVQKDFKRLLAYSSIAHGGYVLIGILSMTPSGYSGAIFYSLALLIMKYACFMVIVKVAHDGRNLDISHLAGLHRQAPLFALMLMLALFGLAGIPPTIGFTGKLLIFGAAIKSGYLYLVLIAMVNVVISLYYYLMVLKAAYLAEPQGELPAVTLTTPDKIVAGLLITIMVIVGFYPTFIINIANAATNVLLM